MLSMYLSLYDNRKTVVDGFAMPMCAAGLVWS